MSDGRVGSAWRRRVEFSFWVERIGESIGCRMHTGVQRSELGWVKGHNEFGGLSLARFF